MSSMQNEPRAFFTKAEAINDFDAIRVSLALAGEDPFPGRTAGDEARNDHYRTFKPERDGSSGARIFGPSTDWEACAASTSG